jgi:hypothetical protein
VLALGAPYDQMTVDGGALPPPGSLDLPFNGPPPSTLALSGIVGAIRGGFTRDDETAIKDFGNPPDATVTVPILLDTGFLSSTSAQFFFFNNITFSPVQSPSMLAQDASPSGLPPNAAPNTAGVNVLSFKFGDVVDFVINNSDTGDHPLHLHGQSFWVMAAGEPNAGPFNQATTALRPIAARDVAAVQKKSHLVIRWVASHADLWFFHCHIEWHLGEWRAGEGGGWAQTRRKKCSRPPACSLSRRPGPRREDFSSINCVSMHWRFSSFECRARAAGERGGRPRLGRRLPTRPPSRAPATTPSWSPASSTACPPGNGIALPWYSRRRPRCTMSGCMLRRPGSIRSAGN